ncbi:MAG: hypothetical protein FE037_04430 [Thermoplasmata archaeon]|nr:MAG: hypothetical protein FE037_04430 [Thermoplasmata archaeon]
MSGGTLSPSPIFVLLSHGYRKDGEKIEYGETGRFAFLDALADSYPGFIISGDEVKLLEHCPVCDRPGPVLEPEVKRARGEEVRGCAEEIRRMLSIGSR